MILDVPENWIAVSTTRWNSEGEICGAVIGTIVAAFYLTLALKTGFGSFDMLALWKASAGTRAAHPEAFKVGFGAVGFGAIGGSVANFFSGKHFVGHC